MPRSRIAAVDTPRASKDSAAVTTAAAAFVAYGCSKEGDITGLTIGSTGFNWCPGPNRWSHESRFNRLRHTSGWLQPGDAGEGSREHLRA